jgi:hypothetical protein
MPLVTLADLHAPTPSSPGTPVYKRVGTRIHETATPMPPPPNARLSATDQATLDSWIASGAPAGDGSPCSTPVSPNDAGSETDAPTGPPPTDCVPDTLIRPTSAYTMLSQEQYACYGFDIPAGPKHHVTQIQVHLDNKAIVHHVLLLESPNSTSGTPIDCSAAPGLGQPMMYAWAPGGNPLVLPLEAGFPQDQTTHYLIQIHYNNAAGLKAPTDSTGFDLCTTANLRKYDADVVAFGTEKINIPPNGSSTSTACYTIPSGLAGRTFFSAFPHMHKLGTTISTELMGDAGAPVDMGAIANWQFSNQPWLPISVVANAGNVVRTSCSWNNPGPTAVTFGEYTTDEMCFSFSAYYPKADSSIGWFGPSTLSGTCQ